MLNEEINKWIVLIDLSVNVQRKRLKNFMVNLCITCEPEKTNLSSYKKKRS